MRACGIAGSLRGGSYNRALLRAALSVAPPGLDIEIFDRLDEIPPYNADVEAAGDPEPVTALKAAIGAADALLVAQAHGKFAPDGSLRDDATREHVRKLLERLVRWTERVRSG